MATVALGGAGLVASAALGACGDEEASTCVDQAGATFCVQRQGQAGIEPTATGLKPGTQWSVVLEGEGVPESAGLQPTAMEVGPTGDAGGMTVGVLGLTSAGVRDGTAVVFSATAADGTPVTATVVVGG